MLFRHSNRTIFWDDEYNTRIFVLDYVAVPMRAPVFARLERVVNEPGYSDTDTILVDLVDDFSKPYPVIMEYRFVYTTGLLTSGLFLTDSC